MLRFNDIADQMLEYNPGVDLERLQRAYVFSAKVHEGQERLSGEPYLVHPLEVAGILVQMRVDDVTVIAGLLHDTLEDTLTTEAELVRLFGEQVAFLVEGLTKIARIEFTSARHRQAENFRKMLLAMSEDIRILLIKLADRLHNMRTLDFMSEDSARRIAQETMDIYVPLAHRLGIHWMKQELEALAFRILYPHVVEEFEQQLAGSRAERGKYVEEVIGDISAKLVGAGVEVEVTGRLKDFASIHAKMESQGISLDEIYDMIAFRIVIEGASSEDCYTVLGMVHSMWRPVPARFKDYVALPKPNGYQSLHTTVIGSYGERMEVQIRSAEMHSNAELGIAAHWKYKEGRIDTTSKDEAKFAWLRQLLEWQRELADPHEFLDAVKVDLFPDEVFVFTPTGEVMTLPQLATALDFAYAIHSEVGDQCAGAKVNGKQVPLRHVLHNGDTVEIRTSGQQFPRKDWLEFVVSGKARTRIRHALRAQGQAAAIKLGRDLLERECRKQKMAFAQMLKGREFDELARKDFRRGTVDELFSAVGYGKVSAVSILEKLRGESLPLPLEPEPAPSRLRSLFRREKRSDLADSDKGIRVSGLPDVLVRFGGCCDPLPGDDVIGFVTRGRGVTVHVRHCPRVFEADPDRRIDVQWDEEAATARPIKVRVTTVDQPGILAKVTKSISAAGINIGAATITPDGANAVQSFELWVTDLGSLNNVMKEIQRVKGVRSVERVRS
ncbi:MAG: bifunctional (p)ppGpp synthetase/guanosine-3',5'-bis(diphosphate) 3'-pyrophosphohydrolase [Myxococcota bacterium]|nr:bifunctional (p)ppGpp synthetase/guanosine-3',5'-bis(diphosphate) 3'-pyrophosphohydrolase [Myxococcota bacterium]